MSTVTAFCKQCVRPVIHGMLAATLVLAPSINAIAGHQGFRNSSVGGITIETDGVVRHLTAADRKELVKNVRAGTNPAAAEMNLPVEIRKISLKGLEAAIRDAIDNHQGQLPDAVKFLGGLQRVEYVLVYPEQNDIVLAGPGEGWKVDANGDVVGVSTGRPVMRLDDLVVALRTVRSARNGEISVSIDPTDEGRKNFLDFMGRQRQFNAAVVKQSALAMGAQQVTLKGVPGDSHFARVLVAADYRMKRLAMKLDESPVDGMPSYLDMLKAKRQLPGSATPRWWMECNYEPLARSEDGLVWQLRGQGVKALSEDELANADGSVTGTGKADPIAKAWADKLTEKFNELAGKEHVFGELRNVMDLAVVAALIERENLAGVAGCDMPLLTDARSPLGYYTWNAAKSIPTQCSFLKIGRNYVITASGGVQVESWQVASRTEVKPEIKQLHSEAATGSGNAWWWN